MEIGIKKGIMKRLSLKNGGIVLDTNDEWLNPIPEIKKDLPTYIEKIKPLNGKAVIVEVLQDKPTYYTSIVPDPISSIGYKNVQETPVSREVLIVRQNAGSQAIGLLEVMQKQKMLDYKSTEEIQALFYKFAEGWEEWVLRNSTHHA